MSIKELPGHDHIDRIRVRTGIRSDSVGIQQTQGPLLGYAVSANDETSGIGDVRESTPMRNYNPARGCLMVRYGSAQYLQVSGFRKLVRRDRGLLRGTPKALGVDQHFRPDEGESKWGHSIRTVLYRSCGPTIVSHPVGVDAVGHFLWDDEQIAIRTEPNLRRLCRGAAAQRLGRARQYRQLAVAAYSEASDVRNAPCVQDV